MPKEFCRVSEKSIRWIGRLFTVWRVSHAEREESGRRIVHDDTPLAIPSSAVTVHPKGTPMPTPSVEVQVSETRVDLSNDMTWRQMIGVGVRRVVLAACARSRPCRLREESSIDSRGQDMQQGGRSCAERRKKPREQGNGRRRRRRRTRQRRATRQRKKRQGRARREGGDREVARRLQRE